MFVDKVEISIKAGNGGNGAVSFHREKYVNAGGPDGGDGGKGSDIVFAPDDSLSTLIDFRYKKKYIAPDGEPGGAKRCSGKSMDATVIKVPRGTVIKDKHTGRILAADTALFKAGFPRREIRRGFGTETLSRRGVGRISKRREILDYQRSKRGKARNR